MTQDEVIRLAQELADPGKADQLTADGEFVVMTPEELVRLAYRLIADERGACAAICDNAEKRKWTTFVEGGTCTGISAADCARAIRDRGNV